ncbi:hypothetical protein SAMN04487972_10391 [Paracoccus halophilus]|uniref:Uncharacterized protein n=1 Tax=Paracoccus halophilus TaxID=376733 RepID=A0A099F3B3_9RHOB|nr:hypothetical protein IT41_07245 [Paracoccus halophilus]SFA43754.1 hypothetical protein SAMN04487972_10391 [Paracoccus halophilus]
MRAKITGIEICQLRTDPVMEPLSRRAEASRQATPGRGGQAFGDFLCCSCDSEWFPQGVEGMLGTETGNISLSGTMQGHSDVPGTMNTIGSHPGGRNTLCQRPPDHGAGNRGPGCKADLLRHMGLAAPFGIIRPDLRQIEGPADDDMAMA